MTILNIPHAGGVFKAVTKKDVCIICGKSDWCTRSTDSTWHICRRVKREDGKERQDRNGQTYYLYRGQQRIGWHPPQNPFSTFNTNSNYVRVNEKILDDAYRRLFSFLPLLESHRADLGKRGISEREIDLREYRSLFSGMRRWDIAKQLHEDLGADTYFSVPGFIRETSKRGNAYMTIAGPPGLLIPVRNIAKLIVAVKIRSDNATNERKRYFSLSSRSDTHDRKGPSPGAQVHVPIFDRDMDKIRITEGELKADIATIYTNTLTISVPGATNWNLAIPIVNQLKPKKILVAFDMDFETNPAIKRATRDLFCALKPNYDVRLETWK